MTQDRYNHLQILGDGPIEPHPEVDFLESVELPGPVTTRLDVPNFVSFCPVTGQPDYGSVLIEYHGRWAVETKSLKQYLMRFMFPKNAAFGEDITYQIAQAIYRAASPRRTFVMITWAERGGIALTTTVVWDENREVVEP